jgi:poly-gamma-glutamate capsule biosynthesis protein CapA/YwtB (metallophosphatase superfamily)
VRAKAVGWVLGLGLGLATACTGPSREHERGGAEAVQPQEAAPAHGTEVDAAGARAAAPAHAIAATPPPASDSGRALPNGDGERASGVARADPSPPAEHAPAPAPPSAPEPRPDALELVFVGDVVLGEYVFDGHRSFAGPLAPGDPFVDVADLLRADLVVGNLESPVMHEIPEESPLRYGHRFGASAPAVAGLAAAGFDVMSVANNHANDLGRDGLVETPEVLRAAGITPVGEAVHEGSPHRVVTLEHRGWRIAFLSATTWLNHAPTPGDPKVPVIGVSRLKRTLVPLVEQARADHDLVIVLLHWGRERRERPEPAQVHAAHAFVDAGADLVIGHHPHVLQGVERYGNGLIAYSLGNFLFPAREDGFRDSAVLRVRVSAEPRAVVEAVAHPLRLGSSPAHEPRIAVAKDRRRIHERLRRLSRSRGTPTRSDGAALALERSTRE